jgi:non-ribosomal peptide synthase protein (TIGR01720 family)
LLLIIHHLVVDGVSWRILLEDLSAVLSAVQRGEAALLAPKTTSFCAWAEQMVAYAGSIDVADELAYWRQRPWSDAGRLPRDDKTGANSAAVARIVSAPLDAAETQALLQDVPSVYRTQVNDVLLTALVETFADWTGRRSLLVALEGHGREDLFADFDVSRTVGWFTSLFPVLLDIGAATDPGEALKLVKEELRTVPNRGIGYGVLRYLGGDVPTVQPEISFNYLGQIDRGGEGLAFRFADEDIGASQAPGNARPHLIDVSAHVRDGCLHMQWAYSAAIHQQSTIETLAEGFVAHLQSLIAHCRASEGGFTLSDFPLLQGSLNF